MKIVLRMSALAVAVVGLGVAAFSPATTQAQPKHASVIVASPLVSALPEPLPNPPAR